MKAFHLPAVALAGAMTLGACADGMPWSRSSSSGATSSTAATGATVTTDWGRMRPSDLIGRSVYTTGGERIGEIDDIVVNRNNRATAAVVGVGGFLGIGEKRVTMAMNQLRPQGDRLVANVTKEQLNQMTRYE